MKIKITLLAVALLAFSSISFAQKKKTPAPAASMPDQVVKNLYAAQKKDATNPFFQTKNRALVEMYFVKDLADMIFKDAVDARGEVGAIDFDPLAGSQDEITSLVVEKPREAGGADNAFVKASFKSGGKADSVDYELAREPGKGWKIVGVYYSNGEDLGSTLRYSQDEEFKKEVDSDQTFTGEYMIGAKKCSVSRTLSGMKHRVQCDGEDDFKLYFVEGLETGTEYINTDEKTKKESKFVFKTGAKDGKFIDATGKEVKVSPIK